MTQGEALDLRKRIIRESPFEVSVAGGLNGAYAVVLTVHHPTLGHNSVKVGARFTSPQEWETFKRDVLATQATYAAFVHRVHGLPLPE